jgi:hypothetical protein
MNWPEKLTGGLENTFEVTLLSGKNFIFNWVKEIKDTSLIEIDRVKQGKPDPYNSRHGAIINTNKVEYIEGYKD